MICFYLPVMILQRTCEEKDTFLSSLPGERRRYILDDNGESDYSRALGPMIALGLQKGIPFMR